MAGQQFQLTGRMLISYNAHFRYCFAAAAMLFLAKMATENDSLKVYHRNFYLKQEKTIKIECKGDDAGNSRSRSIASRFQVHVTETTQTCTLSLSILTPLYFRYEKI